MTLEHPQFSAESQLIHAGTERTAGAPLAPPLMPASTYVSQGEPDPARGYGRAANPGWDAVEEALAAIEGPGTAAVTFPSGQAASMALMLALTRGDDPP
ncbi:MAG: PLP-dependent transferase, partial [Trebonia sp.]